MATYNWKVWLRLNLLTQSADNDYNAEVSITGKTIRNEDIAKRFIDDGSEIKYDTLLNILNQGDRIRRDFLKQGYSVLSGCCQLTPRVKGPWIGSNAKFNPAVHKVTLDMTMSSEMRDDLKQVGIEVLGVKSGGAYIGLVTDTSTGLFDGTITANEDIMIEGERLRVAPENDAETGVFFIDSTGASTAVTRRLTQNDPKKIIARVPTLPAGEYSLWIVTQYSNSNTLLKEARTIEYERKLIVS